MARRHRRLSVDEFRNVLRGPLASPGPPETQSQHYTGPEGLRFDDQGMVLPHSILGNLETFQSYLKLIKRIPKSKREPPFTEHHSQTVEKKQRIPSGHRNRQSNALQHWHVHFTQCRRQQDFLSGLLHRPVEKLLMNQANCFREIQEQRDFPNQMLPLIQSGHGYRVGSEFWSLPQCYGDEMSGITATLTQTVQGKLKPVTHAGQPCSIRQESGLTCTGNQQRPASQTWDQCEHLQQQFCDLAVVLQGMEVKKPDIRGLEVIGSDKLFTTVSLYHRSISDKEEEEKVMKSENVDPLAHYNDGDSRSQISPALRFCGQLATWTGNSPSHQGEVGINATIIFEAPTGQSAWSHLELLNEGSTAILFSWQQLPSPQSFSSLRSQAKSQHFYFNSSSGVILPGDIQQVEFMFKSESAGIKTELWQLNTHPLLLQGGSLQVTLRGVSVYQDRTATQRRVLETKLEKAVKIKMCRSMVYEVLQGIYTPARPSSPAELHITEEQEFLRKNPKLLYFHQPVEELKRLWQEVTPGRIWDFSTDTLRQVLVSLPESAQDTREEGLSQLNSLLLKLSNPSLKPHHLAAADVGLQLWRRLLEYMTCEAVRLKRLLRLPERDTWISKEDEPPFRDSDLSDTINKDEREKSGGGGEKRKRSVESKADNGESMSAATPPVEVSKTDSKRRGKKKKDEERKHSQEKQGEEQASDGDPRQESLSQQPPDDQSIKVEMMGIYTRLLHQKVYALMEDLVESLCDVMDELNVEDKQHTQ
ncbi:MYCBP-associated protein [Aulostomus maculatus]